MGGSILAHENEAGGDGNRSVEGVGCTSDMSWYLEMHVLLAQPGDMKIHERLTISLQAKAMKR